MTGALIRASRGPLVLIALGCLTAADTFWSYPLTRTWPVLLILFGVLKLAEKATESNDGGGYPQNQPPYGPGVGYGAPGFGTSAGPAPDFGTPATPSQAAPGGGAPAADGQ